MRVTFDTNVWNRMVLHERIPGAANYTALVKIKDAIRASKIEGFICESFATTEAIRSGERAKYHAEKLSIVEVASENVGSNAVQVGIQIKTNHGLHPGLTEEFDEELTEAIAIGMKLLPTPYIGVPIPARLLDNPQLYAPEASSMDYSERFCEIGGAIRSRGVGQGALIALVDEIKAAFAAANKKIEIGDRELLKRVYEAISGPDGEKFKERIEKAFAEDADGDMVAAHIAFGNTHLCTEDRGKSAIGASILDAENRAWLKATYGVEIVSATELVALLDP